ncbi:MAG: hypothetical protein K9W46_10670 [Candidatus Heimdallarchaeum endolithica]|uniref:Uncharacterized protein n=1 Tax=Candidatus Heimdallarchaeum endolithica TaxID=2876572 RepID=A0A9Y1BPV8_9ARCH|nr:MAG: hypothetical protein K9W46_10670 [Candidatus Heimdallarchaeum endolithica]
MRKKEKGKKTFIHYLVAPDNKREEEQFAYKTLKHSIKDRILFNPSSTFTFHFYDRVQDFLLSLKTISQIIFLEIYIFFNLPSFHIYGGNKK